MFVQHIFVEYTAVMLLQLLQLMQLSWQQHCQDCILILQKIQIVNIQIPSK